MEEKTTTDLGTHLLTWSGPFPWYSRRTTPWRAAEICGVPRVTLIDRLAGSHKGEVGRPNVLSVAEEKALVQVLVQMGQYNYPLTKRHLSEMVKNYLDKTRETRFIDNRPGRVWIKNFLERHKDQIAIKKANNIRR